MFEGGAALSLPSNGSAKQMAGGGCPLCLAARRTSPLKGEENHGFQEAPWIPG